MGTVRGVLLLPASLRTSTIVSYHLALGYSIEPSKVHGRMFR